jgi:predicted ATP-grasp superfamily ATP-dependent carboligase
MNRVKRHVTCPCILKPTVSHRFFRRFRTKLFEVDNAAELEAKYRLCRDSGLDVICQEIVEGPDSDLFRMQTYVNSKGKLAARFFARKIRQNPPGFGVMRIGVSTPPVPEAEEFSKRLIQAAGYTGYCSIEFKRDSRDGTLKLIEANARMPRSGSLALACGINFPWLMYRDLVHDEQLEVTEYESDVYLIELCADLANSLRHFGSEGCGVGEYLRPYLARRKTFAVLDARDPRPFFHMILNNLTSPVRFAGRNSAARGRA